MHMLKFVFFFHFYVVFIGETGSEFAEITKAFKNRKFNLASDLQTMWLLLPLTTYGLLHYTYNPLSANPTNFFGQFKLFIPKLKKQSTIYTLEKTAAIILLW